MKYVVVVGDGMADRPLADLGGRTLLEACQTPHLDRLAREGSGGTVQTIPDSCDPGSDVANLSILGYDPTQYYTGRAPLEAVSMGIQLAPDDAAFRCNLVTVLEDRLIDYCAGHITSAEAAPVIEYLQARLGTAEFEFRPGVSYRHLLLVRHAPEGFRKGRMKTTPPHDIIGRKFPNYLPNGEGENKIRGLMERSRDILEKCPAVQERAISGKNPSNMIWLWGQGGSVILPSLTQQWNLGGAVISAVDLVQGIGLCAGLRVEKVKGATGFLDTNYQGKVERALQVLEQDNFVYLHVEAPDEAGHSGQWKLKKQAIEDFDAKVIGPLMLGMKKHEAFRILVLPDHATPIELKTHSREPVPFLLYSARSKPDAMQRLTEKEAEKGSFRFQNGSELFAEFMKT